MTQEKQSTILYCDEHWMSLAIEQAKQAADRGEVPVGAVVVLENEVIAATGNSPIALCDPTGHAEILALRQAATQLQNYRLPNIKLYVTLEPCIMCMGAIVHARVKKLVYGADDPKSGAVHSVYQIGQDNRLNHQLEISASVMASECSQLLKDFFKQRRKLKKKTISEIESGFF